MLDPEALLIGVALGALPTAEAGRVALAFLAKRLGVSPKEISRYQEATDDETGSD